jgi:anti-sigma B factor antagonist
VSLSPPPRRDFAVETEAVGADVARVSVIGEVDLSNGKELAIEVERRFQSGSSMVAIDLSRCEFIDTAGLAPLVRTSLPISGNGRRIIALVAPRPPVRRLLELTGLTDGCLPCFATLDEAVDANRDAEPVAPLDQGPRSLRSLGLGC